MVGEKEMNNRHDFNKDPIIPMIKGDWITAMERHLEPMME